MLILSMDCSAKQVSVSLCDDEKLLGLYFQNNGLTHSRTLLVMIENLLKSLDLTVNDVDLLAVSNGPGSFTGIRIGVASTIGLAIGAEKKVCGISTLLAMAYQSQISHIDDKEKLLICPVMDARRDQVYNALFSLSDDLPIRLCEDRAISLEDLSVELSSMGKTVYLVGDGANLTYDFLTFAGIKCTLAPALMRFQSAYGVSLASLKAEHINALDLEPIYLRPSQAERERMSKLNSPESPTAP